MGESELTITIDSSKTKRWRNKSGKLHRLDGPAVEYDSGNKEWFKNEKLHRLDVPAIIYTNGYKEWWINGAKYKTKESYFDALSDEAKEKCLFSEDFLNG